MQRLVATLLRPLVGELLVAPLVGGVGAYGRLHVIAGRQPVAALRDHRATAVRTASFFVVVLSIGVMLRAEVGRG